MSARVIRGTQIAAIGLILFVALRVWPLHASSAAAMDDNLDLGQVYAGNSYDITAEAFNPCKMPRPVTITYPTEFKVAGPNEVTVPARGKQTIHMLVVLKPFAAEVTPGHPDSCKLMKGFVTFTHEGFRDSQHVNGGTSWYECTPNVRKTVISMHVHAHPPPEDPGPGGGGGGKKKKNPASICNILWNHGEFFPSPKVPSPDMCREEIVDLANEYFDDVEPIKKIDPSKFEYLPKRPPDLREVPLKQLLEMKENYDKAAAEVKR